jgi:hypothetical protein
MQDYNFAFVLYGCKTWSLTLREKHRLRMFEETVLRIFGPKRNGVTGGCKRCMIVLCAKYIIRIIKSRMVRLAELIACVSY